ncbi:MAG: VWA domain-containing protein [Verrucomicrobiota bacterium]|nr:VWA domain-containing protein [Verrucomicrobiota bacterium]
MGTLNPPLLWSIIGALGIAVPIIIHLLYRKHRRQTDWAAMELLRRALVTRSGQVKIEDLVILLLRCLALALLALALLRITLDSNSVLADEKIGMVVAIDASYSMNHGEFSRFDSAIDKAREIFGQTAKEGDPVSLVLMSSRPEVLLRSARYDPATVTEILDGLDSAGPNSLNLETNIELLDELVKELKTPGKECFLITDSQEMDWAELPQRTRNTLEQLQEEKNVNIFIVPASNEGEDNLAIESLNYTWGSLRKSGEARFTALVRNTGRSSEEGATLEFSVDGNLTKRVAVGSLAAGESRPLEFTTQFDKAGDVTLQAELSKDDLADDNVRHAVARIRPGIRVLFLEGDIENTAGNRGGSYYAKAALRPQDSDSEEGVVVNEIDPADFGLEKLNAFDVVIMNNVLSVSSDTAKRLKRFVNEGGGLIVFAGDRVEASEYNQSLGDGEGGEGILPAQLGAIATSENEEGWALEASKSGHLLARLTARYPEKLLDAIRITRQIEATPAENSETLITSQSGNPVLLSRSTGSGTVLLFTTTANQRWNNLPREPLYAILLQQAVTMLTSDPGRLQLTVGTDASLPLAKREAGEFVALRTPGAENAEDVRVTQDGDQLVAEVSLTEHGIYEIEAEDDKPGMVVAANVNARESNVRVVEGAALANSLDDTGVKVLNRAGSMADAIQAERRGSELSSRLLLAAIIAFILQSVLARRFTNRINREDTTDLSTILQMSQVAAARRS